LINFNTREGELPIKKGDFINRPDFGGGRITLILRIRSRFILKRHPCLTAGWRLGGGSRQPSRPIQVFKKERLSAMPLSIC